MKKIFVILMLVSLIGSAFAINDLQKAPAAKKALVANTHNVIAAHRDAPEFNISVAPTDIISDYYDYQIGSYNSIPIRLQSDEQGGIYMAFHGRETADASRRVYYAYIDANGALASSSTVSSNDDWEGYCGMDIDPVTGDPFFIYHDDMDGDGDYEDGFVYDMFSVMNLPGLLTTAYPAIDNTDYPDDEYIWPYAFVGPSPVEGKRRLYIYGNNYNQHGEIPSESVLFGYADFSTDDLNAGAQLDFTLFTLPYFDAMNSEGVSKRPMKSMAVSDDGKVAFIGYTIGDDVSAFDANNEFVVISDNYGEEGSWTVHEFNSRQMVDQPVNADGSAFTNPDGTPPFGGQLWEDWNYSGHLNSFFDNNGKLWFTGNQYLQQRAEEDTTDSYYPYYANVKSACYDPATDQFVVSDIYPKGEGEGLFVPWDIDGDGVANVDADGNLETVASWPIFYWKNDLAFHENDTKIIVDGDLKVCVWEDGLKNKYFNDAGDPDYASWATVPEIFISLWNGSDWSDPISINSIDTPEMAGIIPEYTYPADGLKNVHVDNDGNTWGTLYIMYLNDNSFGSSIQSEGAADGGTVQYMAVDLNFGQLVGNNDNHSNSVASAKLLGQNYPNPFNPTTTIAFNMPKTGNANLSIYNVKGQLVKTLVNGNVEKGTKQVVWTGLDNNNMKVSSGVYFYKLNTGNHSEVKRMLLLK